MAVTLVIHRFNELVIAGSNHRNHPALVAHLHRYLRRRNANARHPGSLTPTPQTFVAMALGAVPRGGAAFLPPTGTGPGTARPGRRGVSPAE